MAIVETDLGWEAEEDYLLHDAGEYICNVLSPGHNREYTKERVGYAVVACVHDTVSGWYGPYVISTVSEYANYVVTEYGASGTQYPNATVRHYKRTWYINTGAHLANADILTNFPSVEFSTGSVTQNALAILNQAGVQLYRTDKTWSFLAGMMCGLSGRALPKIGV